MVVVYHFYYQTLKLTPLLVMLSGTTAVPSLVLGEEERK